MNASLRRLVPLCATLLLAVGCSQELQHNLTEQDANDILVLLSENGIDSSKTLEAGGNEPAFTVHVGKADYQQAAKLLTQYSLPRPRTPGLESFRMNKGMIPTQTEERAMMMEALGGEISKSLQKISGVLEAKTIVNMPEASDLTQPEKKPQMTAAVLVKYRPNPESRAPIEEEKIKRFVASSLPDMRPENVVVILSAAQMPVAEVNAETRYQKVFGLDMTAASASQFRAGAAVTALVVLLMAAIAAWGFLRTPGGAKAARPRPRTEG